ncbi:PSMD3-like protein [Mya arenaria]|uniref:PSMD3-like protein n=1 Tax=Mya arenaria TaxID=6604 RepID=A0ABY7E652_MYAAR|nr:PSMD3-like protein [Mya arenaria]
MPVTTDVEMKEASTPEKAKKDEEKKEEPPKDPELLTLEDIRDYIKNIEKSVATKEPRFMLRVSRGINSVRHRLNNNILRKLLQAYLQAQTQLPVRDELLLYLDEPMLTNGTGAQPFRPRSGKLAANPVIPEIEALVCSEKLMVKIGSQNRRTLDILAARCYFYHSRVYELKNQLEKVRNFFHSRLQTAVLRSDFDGQASLLNLLLRNYLHYNLIEQADKLVSKSTKDQSPTVGVLRGPQALATGPKKGTPACSRGIQTNTVRTGNLPRFNEVLHQFGAKFQGEDTYTLIIRLRHNVIKTGAIRDGVIEATIDHEKGYVQSKETLDVYKTREPMAAFHQRITFCLDIHNNSVKAMRFPPKSYNKDLESAEERREREQQELESAKEIADEDFDGFP